MGAELQLNRHDECHYPAQQTLKLRILHHPQNIIPSYSPKVEGAEIEHNRERHCSFQQHRKRWI